MLRRFSVLFLVILVDRHRVWYIAKAIIQDKYEVLLFQRLFEDESLMCLAEVNDLRRKCIDGIQDVPLKEIYGIWGCHSAAASRGLLGRYQRFRGKNCLQLQGWRWNQYVPPKCFYLRTSIQDDMLDWKIKLIVMWLQNRDKTWVSDI
jgi:hypothetical protein